LLELKPELELVELFVTGVLWSVRVGGFGREGWDIFIVRGWRLTVFVGNWRSEVFVIWG